MNGPVAAALDGEVEIVPPGVLKRSMMSMARHPDGAVYLNTQTGPLYRSADRGRSWTPVPVEMPDLAHPQVLHGIGIGGDGRLWLSHSSDREHPGGLYGQDLHVSHSADGGVTWQRSATDFGAIPPGIPDLCFHEDGNRTFVELPDGTLMFSTTVVPAPPYADSFPSASGEAYGGRPGDLFGDLILRSSDGGRTWGDATRVDPFLNPHESNLAVDPRDGERVLLMARCQRASVPNEDPDEFMARTGNPGPAIKQGVLFESTDAGRTFAAAGWTNWYGHRGNVYFAPSRTVVITHSGGYRDRRVVARVSLDGAGTWQDGSAEGTAELLAAQKFVLLPDPPGHSFTTPTVEFEPRHFLTAYGWYPGGGDELAVNGLFWHLEPGGSGPGGR